MSIDVNCFKHIPQYVDEIHSFLVPNFKSYIQVASSMKLDRFLSLIRRINVFFNVAFPLEILKILLCANKRNVNPFCFKDYNVNISSGVMAGR